MFLRLAWNDIREMVDLFAVKDSNLRRTSWANDWVKSFAVRRTSFLLLWISRSFANYRGWCCIVLQKSVFIYFAIDHKDCPVLRHILLVPAKESKCLIRKALLTFLNLNTLKTVLIQFQSHHTTHPKKKCKGAKLHKQD